MQFEVTSISASEIVNSSGVKIEILLQRMVTFHMANTYFPTTCLIVIVQLTLFIDDTNFDTNVMVALTTLLVIISLNLVLHIIRI